MGDKNFRFNKRKTVFCQDRQTKDIYILENNDDVYCLPASEYDVDSIRLVSNRAALITGIDGREYCVNNRGLKCEVFPLEEYSAFSGDYNIVGIKPDGEFFINGKRMYFTDGVVKTENGEVLWNNVKLTGFSLISTEDLEDCKAYAHIMLNEGNSAGYHLDGESLLQNEYLDCYKNSKGCFAYLKNEGYAVEINEPTLNECEKTIASTKRGYFIKGYLIVDPMLSMVERYSPSIYSSLADKIEQIEVENKQELQTFIRETLLEEIISEAKKYGVNIERQHIENRPNIKDVLTVLLNLDNLEEHCSISFKRLAADITGVLTDENYDFTETEYFKNLNVGNRKNFMGYGLSIEKFSSFPEEITFRSTTTKNRLLKDTLG